MKKTVFIILIFLAAAQISVFGQKKKEGAKVKADTLKIDSLEYKLIVLDPGFETWLISKPPKDFYSKEYYEVKNRLFVSEWNQRYMTSPASGLYETYIDYDPGTDYGLEVNYRLYYFFRYFEEKNGIRLIL